MSHMGAPSASTLAAQQEAARVAVWETLKRGEYCPTFKAAPDGNGTPVLGCKHYARTCKSLVACCDVFVSCRLCHDEAFEMADGHVCDRQAIRTVLCMLCDEVQPVGVACRKCRRPFSDYHCRKCVLYAGNERPMHHCDKCGLCRLGTPESNVHCDNCNSCFLKADAETHPCTPSSMKGNCPICCMPLFTSTKPCTNLPCGHSLHQDCHQALLEHDYRCSVCLKSATDTSQVFRDLALMLEKEEPLSPALASRRSKILCNDCSRCSVTSWHYFCHRCEHADVGEAGERKPCGSFNTRVLSVFQAGSAGDAAHPSPSGR